MKKKVITAVEVKKGSSIENMKIKKYMELSEEEKKQYTVLGIYAGEEYFAGCGTILYKIDSGAYKIDIRIDDGNICSMFIDKKTNYVNKPHELRAISMYENDNTIKIGEPELMSSPVNDRDVTTNEELCCLINKFTEGCLTQDILDTLTFLKEISHEHKTIDDLMEKIKEYGNEVEQTIEEAMKETVQEVRIEGKNFDEQLEDYYSRKKTEDERVTKIVTDQGSYSISKNPEEEALIKYNGTIDDYRFQIKVSEGNISSFTISNDNDIFLAYGFAKDVEFGTNETFVKEGWTNIRNVEKLIKLAATKGVPKDILDNRYFRAQTLAVLTQYSNSIYPQQLKELLEKGVVLKNEEEKTTFGYRIRNAQKEKEELLAKIEKQMAANETAREQIDAQRIRLNTEMNGLVEPSTADMEMEI